MSPLVTLYHCTYVNRLDAIAAKGLKPSATPVLLRAAPGNLRGVYLTIPRGVIFWFGRLIDWAEHDSDNPVEEGLVPVVLQVTTTCDTVEDIHGTRDALATALICPRHIVPGAIRLWNGSSWVKVSSGVEPTKGARWTEDEEFEEGGYWELLGPSQSPLMPTITDSSL
jgi:hypothetical protein